MDDFAEIWEREFKLCWYAIRYFEETIAKPSSELQLISDEMIDVVAFQNTILCSMIYNSYNYNTYFGNFAHGICYKIINLINEDFDTEMFPYMNCLFTILHHTNINLYHLDYYRNTPFKTIEDFYTRCLYHKYDFTQNQQIVLKVLMNVLDPNYCIVTKCQSYIRRWLGCREAKKQRLRKVLRDILYAPDGQVELHCFPTFPGGMEFHKCMEQVYEKSITLHVDQVLLKT